ncbi:MAG: PspA/IM30 family protein [SAR324 cluster bacterium]|nr:PspA/IM30 family protein [SAR324 cluster bacterium]
MNMFTRFWNVIRSNINSLLDKAEDPEKMLTQMISDLEEQKRQAKEQIAHALADQKRLERQLVKEKEEVQKWEQKAILAIQHNKDDLAKEALIRKKEHEQRSMEFEKQVQLHTQNTDALRDGYQKLEDKIEEIKRKKGLLVAKQKQAQASQQLYQTLEGMGTNSGGAIATIDRMEEKVEQMQAKSEAYQELSLDSGKDSLEKQFAELGSPTSGSVEMELLELKKRAGLLEHKSS